MQRASKRSFRWLIILLIALLSVGCTSPDESGSAQSPNEASIQLSDLDVTTGQTIYVPAYSEMYIARGRTLDLAVTLTVHNTDFEHPIILTSVRYYDTQGQMLGEYLTEPRQLAPLASTDFFVDANEQSGGLGTNFIVEWVAEQPVFEPIIEAIMLNTSNNQGISLTTPGRVINQIAPGKN
ncbi:MAG: DUF3124 domain-containing protein [Anaerolineales bacterium]|nr:DUF3124 domain-containing protein [Anaerolineales bacterium]